MNSVKKYLLWEAGLVTAVLLLLARVLHSFVQFPFVQTYLSTIVALLFLYGPVVVLRWRGRNVDFLDREKKHFFVSFLWAAGTILIVFPPYMGVAHLWMKFVWGFQRFVSAGFPDFWNFMAYQFLLVALPEEFFFRGYFQTTLNRVFGQPWKILGTPLGWSWILTAVVFAFAHSVISLQWWHFSIFFPALLFGYLRERTGTITAPIILHAFSNIFIDWFSRSYF